MNNLTKSLVKNPLFQNTIIVFLARILASKPQTRDLILKSRASRLEYEDTSNSFIRPVYIVIRTLLEMIPFFGDFISIIEGLYGKEIMGRKLDKVDRVISLMAGLIPVLPATPFREIARGMRKELEDSTLKYS